MPFFDYPFNFIVCLIFFSGYVQMIIEFLKMFITGGSGKNGSTVAVRISFKFFFLKNNFFYLFLTHSCL